MYRIALTTEAGYPTSGWFDADRAKCWDEATRWDGSNSISLATGSQWDHQALYRSATGRYILRSWSQREWLPETYREIPEEDAIEWLIAQGHEDAIPREELEAHEIAARGPTPQRTIRMPDDLWQQVQDRARADGTDASALIRSLVAEYLSLSAARSTVE